MRKINFSQAIPQSFFLFCFVFNHFHLQEGALVSQRTQAWTHIELVDNSFNCSLADLLCIFEKFSLCLQIRG